MLCRSYTASPSARKYAKVLYSFVAHNVNELSVLQDEILEVRMQNGQVGVRGERCWKRVLLTLFFVKVLESDNQWWKLRNRSGQVGLVPSNTLAVITLEDLHSVDPAYSQVTYSQLSH